MAADPLAKARKRILKLTARMNLAEVSEGTSYGNPALKVRDKSFVIVKDAETLSLMMPLEQKELLMEVAPEIYYETDHYKGWPAVLVRLAAISDPALSQRLAWRHKAPKRLLKETGQT